MNRLDEAATQAFELVQEYAEFDDPRSESGDNPWRNPEAMFEALDKARKELNQAWKEQQAQHIAQEEAAQAKEPPQDLEEFRALYMDMITDSFAGVLENMRQQEDQDINVDVLVDCLQSGMEMLSSEDRGGFFQALEDDYDEDDDDSQDEPCHQLHRRGLGLDISAVASF